MTTIYASSSSPSVVESIHITNKTDSGDYPVSITITSGTTTSYLAKDLIVPRYASVELLERPKHIPQDATIMVGVGQTQTIDVIVSGRKLS